MSSELVGEPAVSAFLRSLLRNLADILQILANNLTTNFFYYDPNPHLREMEGKLKSLRDLLVDGEARRLHELSVDEWMDDLKHLFYDLEDILDDVKSLWKGQVRDDVLKSFSDDVNNRFETSLATAKKLQEEAEKLKLKRGKSQSTQPSSTLDTRATSSILDTSEIIRGREDDKGVILKRLLEVNDKGKKNYDVIGIWGMGGLGKTTLAQLVFSDPEVVEHFEVRRWVCISDVFDVSKAIKGLLEDDSPGDAQSLQILHQRLQNIIQKKRFLFVLDDMWPTTEWNKKWNKIKTPFNSCQSGSKILVTTRHCNIPLALGDEKPYQLEGLPHEHCILLFKDNADVNDGKKEKLMKWGEKIARACNGLPLAVKVIGSMLQRAKEEKWRAVSENTDLWDTSNIKDEIHPAIRFSYHYLSASPKRCFEYLAVFPPDYKFDQDEVVRLWIAEGLVEEVEGRRVEDIGNEYYNELEARSLIQRSSYGKYTMHDIIQHLATVVSRKYCYKENSNENPASVRHAFLVNRNSMHNEFLAQASYLRTLIDERFRVDENVVPDTIRSWKMLRTLIIYCHKNYSLGEISACHLTHLRFLRIHVLDSSHLLDSICMLDNLKFLVLPFMQLKQLPETIGNLRSLRALDLCCSSISGLPELICSLCELQVLNLSFCTKLKELPKDIGNLRILSKLNLEGTSISSLPASVCSLRKLQVLKLRVCKELKELPKDIGNLRILSKLNLEGSSISSLPASVCSLRKLQVLKLQVCKELKELPKDIGQLRSLRELDLSGTSILSVPESILNVTGLQKLLVSESIRLPLHIGRLEGLVDLSFYPVEKEEGRRLGELSLMNSLRGSLTICRMENIGGVEEAEMADLKSKKNLTHLQFRWSQPGNDEKMEVKITEALEPYHALTFLNFSNYGGNKFPSWMMAGNICWSNLTSLTMKGLNKICEMIDMEFISLNYLRIENCPKLRKIVMATPKLRKLYMNNCGELEADCVHLLPSLSDKVGLLSIVSQLKLLECEYKIFEYFFEKLKTQNSKWYKLRKIELNAGGRRVDSLPGGWPSMMDCIEWIAIGGIGPGKFRILPDGDQSAFPPSLYNIAINDCEIDKADGHHRYTITWDGKVKRRLWYTVTSDGRKKVPIRRKKVPPMGKWNAKKKVNK